MDTPTMMTRSEREEFARLVRLRLKVVKARLKALAADRLAEVEAQLFAIHKADAAPWRDITAEINRLAEQAATQIAQTCDAYGIPRDFRPNLQLSWYGRGVSACVFRRNEVRKLAHARVEADRKAGDQLVDQWAAEKLTALISGTLTSIDASALLETLPSPETLLPPVHLTSALETGVLSLTSN